MKKSEYPVPFVPLNSKSIKTNAYRAVIVLIALGCGRRVQAQAASSATNAPPNLGSSTNVTKLQEVTVIGQLDQARNQIVPSLGATSYTISKEQIASQAQGENAAFNQLLLRAPGVAQDSLGQLHLRGEHANLQYRINDVLLPEGITGFGQELDTRFVDSVRLLTGSLPAQYGFRTAGIVDITTKSGVFEPGGQVSMYGGNYDTIVPSFEYGGSEGKLNYFADGSFNHNGIGIENPTASATPIHDTTEQYKYFTYLSYLLDDTSRLSVILSASYADFQIPDSPGLPAGTSPNGSQWVPGSFDSTKLNETQNEQNYYGVVAYQNSMGDFNMQVAAFGRNSSVHFTPDATGDLYFNGVASDVARSLYTGGFQGDASYNLNDSHTLRGGAMVWDEAASADTTTGVFPVDAAGNPTGPSFPLTQNSITHGIFYGLYLQDEWKVTQKLTVNYGARFDGISSYIHENQISPRLNAIYKLTDKTTLHAGYARYFTPPPLELVGSGTVTAFNGTSNGSANTQDDPVKAERSHYFDAGITHQFTPELQVGIDGYYKFAHNQLDDGFFGQTLILSPFNYRVGQVDGVEVTITYTKDGFSTYANLAFSDALGKQINSAEFLFAADKLAYTQDQYIHLDHDQRITGSFGASYTWKESRGSTKVFADALYGSGLRTDGTDSAGGVIPNGASVGPYYSVNLGAEQAIAITPKQVLKARVDAINITDNIYELRNGAGVGVNAAQYGMRLGFFGTVSYSF